MTLQGVAKLIERLSVYYPRVYSPNMPESRGKMLVQDFMKAFEKYSDEAVLEAAYKWHLKNSQSCNVADLIGMLYGMERIDDEEYKKPTTWKNYFEDADGYGYATNVKTKEIECIWKPNWKNERRAKINGEWMVFPPKGKIQTLREHGLVRY